MEYPYFKTPRMSSAPSLIVHDAVNEIFKGMKLRRKYKYIVVAADPTTFELSVEATGGPRDGLDSLLSVLPSSDCRSVPPVRDISATLIPRRFWTCLVICACAYPLWGRYAFYDHSYTSADGRPCDKLYFIFWAPDIATPAAKMYYASHRSAVRALSSSMLCSYGKLCTFVGACVLSVDVPGPIPGVEAAEWDVRHSCREVSWRPFPVGVCPAFP